MPRASRPGSTRSELRQGCDADPLVHHGSGWRGRRRASRTTGPWQWIGYTPWASTWCPLRRRRRPQVDIAGCIVHGDIIRRKFDRVHPLVASRSCNIMPGRAIRRDRQTCAGAPHAWAPRGPAAHGLARLKPQPVVAALEAVIGHQLLVEVLGRSPVAGCRTTPAPAPPRPPAMRSRGGPGGGRSDRRLPPPRSGRASAGRSAPDTQNLRRLRLAQATPMGAPSKPPRTSSISVPVPAVQSDASPP